VPVIARTTRVRAARGFTLIEVLIALVVLAFGMLSLARVLGRSAQEELEAYQRTQAMTVAAEMVDRVTNNPKLAAGYVDDYAPYGPLEDCTALDPADVVSRDKCEWRNRLRGADVLDAERGIGAPLAARGCVFSTGPNIYVVAVAWQGVLPTDAADSPCGKDTFGTANEKTRRVYSTTFQIATLGV
jgi:type IV pilus assembly protein PilV